MYRNELPYWQRSLAALILLVAGLFALLPAAPARAEGENVSLEVLGVGWDGHVALGYWSPVRLRVTGGAADQDALVEVWLEGQYQTGPTNSFRYPLASFGQEISIPAHASKEVLVWVPAGFGNLGSVKLTANGQELASQSIEFRPTKAPYWPLVGVLSDQEGLASQVGQVTLPLQGLPTAINVARIPPALVPTEAGHMKGLNGLVVQGNLPAHLTDPQRTAILEWVKDGGHLVLAGGPDSALTAGVLPAGQLPMTFGGAVPTADLSALLQWSSMTPTANKTGPIVRMKPEGGEILAGTAEQPLVWRNTLGRGMITVLAVDPTLEPLASAGNGLASLWKTALGRTVSEEYTSDQYRYQRENELYMANRLRQVIEAMPPDAFPTWKVLALWLGGFALLAGPIVHLAFWRPSRRRWVWLAVPLASVLVAGTVYATGITVGGRDMVGHAVSHLRINPQEGTAYQSLMLGVHAPMYPKLAVNLVDHAPVNGAGIMDGPRWGPFGPEAVTEPPFRMIAGRVNRIEYSGGESQMRAVTAARYLSSEVGQIGAKLRVEGDQIKGTVTNNTTLTLEGLTILVARTAQKVGDLAPGESAEVAITLETNDQPYGYQPISILMLGKPMEVKPGVSFPAGQPMPMELPRDPEIQRRARLIDATMQMAMGKMGPESMTFPLTALAFTKSPVGPDVANLEGHPIHHLTLVEQQLQLDLPAGPFRLPSALITGEVMPTNVRGWGGGSDGKISWVEFDNGSMAYTYTLPLPAKAEVTDLTITTQQIGKAVPANNRGQMGPPGATPDPAESGVFQVYNWQKGEWEWLPGGSTEVKLSNAGPYVSADRQVKVQVWSGSDRVIRFVVPRLIVEGRIKP